MLPHHITKELQCAKSGRNLFQRKIRQPPTPLLEEIFINIANPHVEEMKLLENPCDCVF